MDLNGNWKFAGSRRPADRPVNFYTTHFDVSGWDEIRVPANWQFQGYGVPYYTNTYTVLPDGSVRVEASLAIGADETPELPRFGMKLALPGRFKQMTWLGRGPHESYWDRKTGAFVGLYSGTVQDQHTPYVSPQENGNKTDVRWVILQDESGLGLLVKGSRLLEVNAHHYLEEDFDSRVRHSTDVPFQNVTELCIDLHQRGIGGDNSWGNPIHDKYKLRDKQYKYAFVIIPVRGNQDAVVRQALELRAGRES